MVLYRRLRSIPQSDEISRWTEVYSWVHHGNNRILLLEYPWHKPKQCAVWDLVFDHYRRTLYWKGSMGSMVFK